MEDAAPDSIRRGSRRTRRREPPQRRARCGRGSLPLRGLAAGLAAAALLAPAAAASEASIFAQAKAELKAQTDFDESHHIIPFKQGTRFTVSCGLRPGPDVLCTEHAGPERCVNHRPWILISDIFPIIRGRVGDSLSYGPVETNIYCRAH